MKDSTVIGTKAPPHADGIPLFMLILPVEPRCFAFVYANGDEVEERAYVEWRTQFNTPELRAKAVGKRYAKVDAGD